MGMRKIPVGFDRPLEPGDRLLVTAERRLRQAYQPVDEVDWA
jgi:hypothetical protein